MAHHSRYAHRVTPDRDRCAPCGCREVLVGAGYQRVVWCPDHQDVPCPGPWYPTLPLEPRDDYYPDDDWDGEDYEEDEWENAMQECGQLPEHLGGGCMMAGSEYCDFECPFSE